MCPKHDRAKNDGYRVFRDEAGQWHTYRPNGTEIGAAAECPLGQRPKVVDEPEADENCLVLGA